jgi:hypothetical protein
VATSPQSRLSVKDVIWKVSPAVTAADADKAPVHKQLPAVELSHADQWLYVSVVDTFVHSNVAEVAMEPDDATDHEVNLRVVFAAALLVPSSPASPVWSLMYTADGAVHDARPVR